MKKLPECLEELAKELPPTLTRKEAAEVMRVSVRTLERMVDRGELQVMKAGRVVVLRGEVLRWMEQRMSVALVQPGQQR